MMGCRRGRFVVAEDPSILADVRRIAGLEVVVASKAEPMEAQRRLTERQQANPSSETGVSLGRTGERPCRGGQLGSTIGACRYQLRRLGFSMTSAVLAADSSSAWHRSS